MQPNQPAQDQGTRSPLADEPDGAESGFSRPSMDTLLAAADPQTKSSQAPKGLSWQCISGCGACCRLDPGERPEALEALDADEQELYLSMVGADGWCRHYDTGGQRCRIYDERPRFCRVTNLASIFAVAEAEANGFAIACCRQQIRSEHGGRGKVLRRFERALRQPPAPLS